MYGINNNTGNLYERDNGLQRITSGITSAKKIDNGFDRIANIIKAFLSSGHK